MNDVRCIVAGRHAHRRVARHAVDVTNTRSTLPNPRPSHRKLLAEDALFQIVFGIEQQRDLALRGFADGYFDHVADFVRVGGDADRALVGVEHAEAHLGICLENGAAPAPRAIRRDRRQRQRMRAKRQDRPVRGIVVRRAAGRRGHHHAIADQLGDAGLAVEIHAQMRGLPGLPQQRDLVVGQRAGTGTGFGLHLHLQRPQIRRFGALQALEQVVLVVAVLVHQKADRAQLHAEHRLVGGAMAVQRLQHEPVAAQRTDDVGAVQGMVAIALRKARARGHRRLGGAGKKSDAR
ncbi:hypothetical protein XAP6164_990009 [Xanthomonas phaseoli pv. phaseoli]|nr:hypothetical protein XAP6164_990009 [Xanthomonas phaseoli pv. phaseoli]